VQPQDTRRTLKELRVLHTTLEPELRDVYAESRRDARFYAWLLQKAGIKVSGVYAIDDRLLVSASEVGSADGEVGPRGRLLGLAFAVTSWGIDDPRITCIVDADWDLIYGGPNYPDLLRTDGGSVEVYSFAPRPLQHFLDLVLSTDRDATQLLTDMVPLLNDLYMVRGILHRFGPGVPVIERFVACCTCCGSPWTVDVPDLIKRSLNAAALADSLAVMLEEFDKAGRALPVDRRLAVRGHDIAPILAKGLGLTNEWSKREVIEGSLRGCLQFDDMEQTSLLTELRGRFT
jgi:hypothetical protein